VVGIAQNHLANKAREAQIFQTIEAVEAQVHFREAMEAVQQLRDWPGLLEYLAQPGEKSPESVSSSSMYARFKEEFPEELRPRIYMAVSFLNGIARLADRAYLAREHIWLSFLGHYELCQTTLLPWWLAGICASESLRRSGQDTSRSSSSSRSAMAKLVNEEARESCLIGMNSSTMGSEEGGFRIRSLPASKVKTVAA
jgi:hypothetical protein